MTGSFNNQLFSLSFDPFIKSSVEKMETDTLNNFIYVKTSDIHGSGLFTSINIKAGSRIMIISGEVISGDECERREEKGNVYIFWNGDNYIDTSSTDKIKYINHDCEYNCLVEDRDDDSLLLIAAKDIQAGDELTIDYGYEEIYESCKCATCGVTVRLTLSA